MISMAYRKTAVSPLLEHWKYSSLALNHRYMYSMIWFQRLHILIGMIVADGLVPIWQKDISDHQNEKVDEKWWEFMNLNSQALQLWGFYYENLEENRLRYNGIAL